MIDRRDALRAVAAAYWSRFTSDCSALPDIDDALLDRIRRERHECRVENGGGGSCHLVTEWLEHEFGLERMAVSFLTPDGTLAVSGHYVSLAADGTIVDATADQFGQGHDVRILRPDDPDYGLYRPEFYDSWNPQTEEKLAAWRAFPGAEHGWDDFSAQTALTEDRGRDWWLEDRSERVRWLERDAAQYGGRWSGFEPG